MRQWVAFRRRSEVGKNADRGADRDGEMARLPADRSKLVDLALQRHERLVIERRSRRYRTTFEFRRIEPAGFLVAFIERVLRDGVRGPVIQRSRRTDRVGSRRSPGADIGAPPAATVRGELQANPKRRVRHSCLARDARRRRPCQFRMLSRIVTGTGAHGPQFRHPAEKRRRPPSASCGDSANERSGLYRSIDRVRERDRLRSPVN